MRQSPSVCRPDSLALVASISGFLTSTAIGSKSRSTSYGSLAISAELTVKVVGTTNSVCPSGDAFATASAPSVVLAPERFSTMIGCLSDFSRCGWIRRTTMSCAEPAVAGTMKRIGRFG